MTALSVRILSLHWKNIRAFDSLDAPLKTAERYNSLPDEGGIFLQMPNGTGKTTTLHLLRCAFTGVIPDFTEHWRRLIQVDEKAAYIDDPSIFEVRLLINGQIYGIELKLDHENEEHQFTTTTPTGRRKGWHLPQSFERAFRDNHRLVELFIFDAETARQMVQKTDDKLLQHAIRQFGGFSEVFALIGEPSSGGIFEGGRFETVKTSLQKDIGRLGEKKGGARQKSWIKAQNVVEEVEKDLKKQISETERRQLEVSKELAEVNDRLSEIETEYGKKFERVGNLQKEISTLKTERINSTMELMDLMMNPSHVFVEQWEGVVKFHCSHQDSNLPADVGRGWLLKLAEGTDCICGTAFNDDMRKHIREHGEKHLDRQKMVSVSEMQSEFKATPNAASDSIQKASDSLNRLSQDIEEKQTNYEAIFREGASNEIAEEKSELADRQFNLKVESDELEYKLTVMTTNNMEWLRQEAYDQGLTSSGTPTVAISEIRTVNNLNILVRINDHLTSLIAESQGQSRIWEGLKLSRDVLSKAVSILNSELRKEISEEATYAWRRMPAAGAERNLRLSIEDDGMGFFRGDDRAHAVSGAQSVSACYSITQAIANLGDISIPLICDTPFAGFDSGMVPNWYEGIANSFDQYVVLVNTLEKRALQDDVWSINAGEDYKASVHHVGNASDGGRKFEFSTDSDIFINLKSANDSKEVR